jgi:hypothetical protein
MKRSYPFKPPITLEGVADSRAMLMARQASFAVDAALNEVDCRGPPMSHKKESTVEKNVLLAALIYALATCTVTFCISHNFTKTQLLRLAFPINLVITTLLVAFDPVAYSLEEFTALYIAGTLMALVFIDFLLMIRWLSARTAA